MLRKFRIKFNYLSLESNGLQNDERTYSSNEIPLDEDGFIDIDGLERYIEEKEQRSIVIVEGFYELPRIKVIEDTV